MTTNTKTMTVPLSNTRYMVELALMVAIILLMSFTPLGYVRTPGLSITLLTIPVAVGAIILGPKGGTVCGAAFGLTSFSQSFTTAFGTMMLSISPVGTFITTVVTRTLEGLLCGLIFSALYKNIKTRRFSYYIASLACPVLNTVLFMSSLILFFYHTEYIQNMAAALGAANPFLFVVAFVGLQGAVEAVVCFLAASVISRTLAVALRRS